MNKERKIIIVLIIIILIMSVIISGFIIKNNQQLNKVIDIGKEQLTTENGFITTEDHLQQIDALSGGKKVYQLSEGNPYAASFVLNGVGAWTYDIKSLFPDEYMNFTTDSFVFDVTSFGRITASRGASATTCITKSYDATTGILTMRIPYMADADHVIGCYYRLLLIY